MPYLFSPLDVSCHFFCLWHASTNFMLKLSSVRFLSPAGPGSAALPSNMKYFGSAHDDEDADEEEEEEEEENERKKPSASNITTSCQVTPRKSKAPSRVITNGNGIFSPFLFYSLFLFDYMCCDFFPHKKSHQTTKYIIAGP